MDNFFDQFDGGSPQPAALPAAPVAMPTAPAATNFFDQFDGGKPTPTAAPAATPTQPHVLYYDTDQGRAVQTKPGFLEGENFGGPVSSFQHVTPVYSTGPATAVPANAPVAAVQKRNPGQRLTDTFSHAVTQGPTVALENLLAQTVGPDATGHDLGKSVASQAQEDQQLYAARTQADPFYKADGGLIGKAVAGGATLVGGLAGGLADPIVMATLPLGGEGVAAVKGAAELAATKSGQVLTKVALNSVGRKALVSGVVRQGAAMGALDLGTQALNTASGVQDKINPDQVASSALFGAALPIAHEAVATIPGLVKGLAKIFSTKDRVVTPESVTPEMVAESLVNPDVVRVLQANGIVDLKDPAHAAIIAKATDRVEQIRAAEAAKTGAPDIVAKASAEAAPGADGISRGTADQLSALAQARNLPEGTREDVGKALSGEIDPSQIRAPTLTVPPETIHVDPTGRADLGDPGTRAGADLRTPESRTALVPVDQPRTAADVRMSPEEVARAQRAAEAGQANPIPKGDTLHAPEGRAPQTRDDVAGQRDAAGAFDLAARQSDRVEPGVRDTQTAGLPAGPEPVRVLMDEGFPVKVVAQGERGKVTVQRYDPRTGELDPEAVPYDTHMAALSQKPYTPEPRRAQDFNARDNPARMSPELPGGGREDTQTYRATAQDEPRDGNPFPGANGPDARPPIPEQPAGPHPGRDQPRGEAGRRFQNEEEARADYERRRSENADAEFDSRTREGYKGKPSGETGTTNTPAARDAEGFHPVDEFGFVKSNKGGPIVFPTQKAVWDGFIKKAQAETGASYEIANHPTRKGLFTARETGRDAAPAEANIEEKASGGASPQGRTQEEATGSTRGGEAAPPEHSVAPHPVGAEPVRAEEGPRRNAATSTRDVPPAGVQDKGSAPEYQMADAEGAPAEPAKTKGKGSKFYSNPLDPEAIHDILLKPAVDAFKRASSREAEAAGHEKEALRQAFAGKGPDPMAAARAVRRVLLEAGTSIAGALQSYARQYKDVPVIRQLADLIATEPGSGRATPEPYEYGARRSAQQGYTPANNVIGDWIKATGITSDAIRQAMTGGKMSAADAPYAARLRAVMDAWHKKLNADFMTGAVAAMGKSEAERAFAAGDIGVGKVTNYFPRNIDPVMVDKNPEGFLKAAEAVFKAEGAENPKLSAAAWKEEILTGGDLHVSRTPGGTLTTKATRERTFKTSASDKLLAPFMQDAKATLADYFSKTARQAEFAKRFGPKGELLDQMFDKMREGGVSASDLSSLRRLTDTALGLVQGTKPTPLSATLGWVHTVYTMRVLARSLASQITEPFVMAIRTGDIGLGLRGLGAYLEPVTKGGRESIRASQERLNFMGVMGDVVNDAMLLNRTGTLSNQSRMQSFIMTKAFKNFGVTPITEFQVASAGRFGEWRLGALLDDLGDADHAPSLRALADEYGISASDAAGMKKWRDSFGGKPPPISELMGKSPHGAKYSEAIYRWVNENVQNPTRADKPAAASDPRYAAAYGITSFLFTYTRKVYLKAIKDVAHSFTADGYTPTQKVLGALGPSVAMGLYTAMGYGLWYAKQKIFNPQIMDELSSNQKAYAALSQSQMLGTAQPLIDMGLSVTGRFGRDLTSAYSGPQLTQALGDVASLAKGMQGGSPDTNNAEWQGSRAAYNMVVANAVLTGSQLLPVGPLGRVGVFAADQLASAPGTSRAAADAMAGERTVRPHVPGD